MSRKKLTLILAGFIVATVLFWRHEIQVFAQNRYADLQLFAKVLNLVQEYYVEPVDTKTLIYGGIKGMLLELDPHTNFLPPDLYKEFESETSGEFGGLGIEITLQKNVLTIISPIEDGPAYKAGIQAGDKILTINGKSTKNLSLSEAAQQLKGKNGDYTILGIFREGFDAPKDFKIRRGTVKVKSVKLENLGNGYAYVRITSFIEKTAKDFKRTLDKFQKDNKQIAGVILDLRRNPGGLLDQAVRVADYLIQDGVIVSTIGRDKKQKEVIRANASTTYPPFPLMVLIDEYSASASEIVAGALQDNQRALILGQRSFGKGSVQSVVKLGDGSGMKLTVARYYTPRGVSIQAYGITPDVYIENLDPAVIDKARVKMEVRREKDIHGHLKGDLEKKAEEDRMSEPLLHYFFGDIEDDTKKKSSGNELLKRDFYVQQAYNYLQTWSRLKSFDKLKQEVKRKKN